MNKHKSAKCLEECKFHKLKANWGLTLEKCLTKKSMATGNLSTTMDIYFKENIKTIKETEWRVDIR